MSNAQKVRIAMSLIILTTGIGRAAARDYGFEPVPFTKVHFADRFWLGRMETNRTVTIPFAFKQCEETGRIENFKVAGKLSDKLWEGNAGYNDSDVFKVMEGAAYALMVRPDPKLDAYMDELISYVAAAQEPDGYLYTLWTAQAKKYLQKKPNASYINEQWDNLKSSHELYNAGHMYEAAVAHYLATGKRTFLDVAIKNADLVCKTFGPQGHLGVPGHQEIEIGLAKLYRVTGDEKYLNQARWFLNQRGRSAEDKDPYRQMHMPPVEQTEAVGHAVRATYMYTGMADVAAMTGDETFIKAIDTIWDDVANKKLYVTGGIGARRKGEAYGDAYELPNVTAYCETCAAIANVYWNHRMFLLHGQSKYIDVMERSLYNAVLSGVALDGMHFFYPNPLESAEGHQRSDWFGCACCPSNICRFIASVPGYTYAVRDNAVYVNLFVNSSATFEVRGKEMTITQTTDYPWDGKVTITVEPKDKEQSFALKVRVPDWTQDKATASALYRFAEPAAKPVAIAVNGNAVDVKPASGYAVIERAWKSGDKVEVSFPMPVRRVLCDASVTDNMGKSALMRGPLVYCVEGVDVEDGKALELALPEDIQLTTEYRTELLGGVTVIKGNAQNGIAFQAIPYYAWAHRGKTSMAVWLPYLVKMNDLSRN
ncbi:MAG: glycoside hydrolase family 127 protein [Planctomycetaceae bacterium]|nr:glycoside hydrolase family 127 protein [Planctomycetaceae bacterium]